MEVEMPVADRIKELANKKRKVQTKIKRAKRALVKARVEKKKIDSDIVRLKSLTNAFDGLSPEAARDRLEKELDQVKPEDIYPEKLEKSFDRMERPKKGVNEREVIDLGGDDMGEDADGGDDLGVVDLSDQ